MPAVWIVPPFDVFEKGSFCVVERAEAVAVQQLAFDGCEETLAQGVVKAVADGSHGGTDTGLLAAQAKGQRRLLRSLVGMMDHVVGPALPQGHIQRVQNQLGVQARVHRPTDNAYGIGIQDHGKVEEA